MQHVENYSNKVLSEGGGLALAMAFFGYNLYLMHLH
jgi:hypothetical protein